MPHWSCYVSFTIRANQVKKLLGTHKGVLLCGIGQLQVCKRTSLWQDWTFRKVSDQRVIDRKSQLQSFLVLGAEIGTREANFSGWTWEKLYVLDGVDFWASSLTRQSRSDVCGGRFQQRAWQPQSDGPWERLCRIGPLGDTCKVLHCRWWLYLTIAADLHKTDQYAGLFLHAQRTCPKQIKSETSNYLLSNLPFPEHAGSSPCHGWGFPASPVQSALH